MVGQGGDLPLRLQIKSAFLRRSNRLLLQDEGFLSSSVSTNYTGISTVLVQRGPVRTLKYNRLAVVVHEHLLRTTDLLAHGIVDRVTGAPNVVSLQRGFHHPTGRFP